MTRIAIGGFLHESHSFAPLPTGWAEFISPGGFPPLQRPATLVEALRQDDAGQVLRALDVADRQWG